MPDGNAKKFDRIQEQDRIHDLEERCAKKGLDFETENRKYLEKQSRKKKKIWKEVRNDT